MWLIHKSPVLNRVIHVLNRIISVLNRTIFALCRIISVSNTKRDVKAFLFPLFNKLASWSVKYILVLPEFWDFKMAVGNWTSCRAILVWNHTCDFKSNWYCALIRFWSHSYYFRPNCTPLSSITIVNCIHLEITRLWRSVQSDWLSTVWFIPKSRSLSYHYLLSGFIMLHIYGVATALSATFALIFLSLLWTVLKLKTTNKEQFVPVSVLFF